MSVPVRLLETLEYLEINSNCTFRLKYSTSPLPWWKKVEGEPHNDNQTNWHEVLSINQGLTQIFIAQGYCKDILEYGRKTQADIPKLAKFSNSRFLLLFFSSKLTALGLSNSRSVSMWSYL